IVQNKVQPQENTISEFEKVAAEEYFKRMQFILEVFGYKVFSTIEESISDARIYYLKSDHTEARAQLLVDGGLNVQKGSYARIKETASIGGWAKAERLRLLKEGILMESEKKDSYIFEKDLLFKSPSAAAATCTGRAINGWIAWKDEKGKTLDENVRKG
ncbi:DUF4357 domain-containing protein, partial [Candidatus Uhrbacteria bacterium]|nr:DUF4357 domain-containing protein [Candidatus Uhrbacteria bacterium]